MTEIGFHGIVEKGEGIATGLGCPTANVAIRHGGIIPGLGVYAAEVDCRGGLFPAVVCVNDGRDHHSLKLEVHLLDQCLPGLEGTPMGVRLRKKLRDLVPWESDAQMRALIAKDLGDAKAWFRTVVPETP